MQLNTYHMREEEFTVVNDLKRTSSSYQGNCHIERREFSVFLRLARLGVELQAKREHSGYRRPCHMGKPSLSGFVLTMEKRKRWRRERDGEETVSWPPPG